MVTRTCALWPDVIEIAVGLKVIQEAADMGPLSASWNVMDPSSLERPIGEIEQETALHRLF